jgi:hypothetical protein
MGAAGAQVLFTVPVAGPVGVVLAAGGGAGAVFGTVVGVVVVVVVVFFVVVGGRGRRLGRRGDGCGVAEHHGGGETAVTRGELDVADEVGERGEGERDGVGQNRGRDGDVG